MEQFFKKVRVGRREEGSGTERWWLEEEVAEVSMQRHGQAKQLVVFFGAASIGTRGGWGADAVLRACCKWPHASPPRPHAAARQPHRQQPQSQGPALPCQPSAARLSQRQLSPTRPRARLLKPSQHHSQAGGWTGTATQR
ncbi:hypothetical protein HaLaN_20227 [Haematococcus lacustris]|uniref:Uncharacterized protein n=1 Tax=Haematococcus lacustris TaxID=44745 RepID=A0A699ZIZ7_HAELA|nr:hypothetical protein HaLaN_20227 [Haematococcus lacustris]